MYIKAGTVDDLLGRALRRLLRAGRAIYTQPTQGAAAEIRGALLHLTNPRARLSQSASRGRLFSALGELLWYLAGSDELSFIQYYIERYSDSSDDGRTIRGAYGPRLFGKKPSEISRVIQILLRHSDTRRAVVQVFRSRDTIEHYRDVPCTTSLQFLLRNARLDLITNMRSNDAYLGLPHDVFAFTMLQELVARSVGVEVGHYYHFVGSLHLYLRDRSAARRYVREGWQPTTIAMPAMPLGSPWADVERLTVIEKSLRLGRRRPNLPRKPYWRDLGTLLQVYRHARDGDVAAAERARRSITSRVYGPYVGARLAIARREARDRAQS